LSVIGDGKTLYTSPSFPSFGSMANQPFFSSPQRDGASWAAFENGDQKFDNGPYRMRFDAVNKIVYSANWNAGIWALKSLEL
jgi:hypothetical protein